jgi:membrane peptidoglycan carboxypeptidase
VINTISAKLGEEVGFRTVADMAQRFGITTKVNTQPSMVLGTSDVRLLDMTRAFAAVASKGVAVVPYGIRRVTTAKGQLLYTHEADTGRTLVAPWVAAQMTDLLQAAVLTGTGRAAQIGRPVAGKTGTTSSNKDGWFIGFSSGITTGVWMGRDDARPIPGSRAAARRRRPGTTSWSRPSPAARSSRRHHRRAAGMAGRYRNRAGLRGAGRRHAGRCRRQSHRGPGSGLWRAFPETPAPSARSPPPGVR